MNTSFNIIFIIFLSADKTGTSGISAYLEGFGGFGRTQASLSVVLISFAKCRARAQMFARQIAKSNSRITISRILLRLNAVDT
jgi:hypothetical protein